MAVVESLVAPGSPVVGRFHCIPLCAECPQENFFTITDDLWPVTNLK